MVVKTLSILKVVLLSYTLVAPIAANSAAFNTLITKKLIKKKAASDNTPSYFHKSNLKSQFASWGIDPAKTSSSINILKAWQKFKKKKDIIVAVVDTGIAPNHPFLKNNLHVIKGKLSHNNYGVDFSAKKGKRLKPVDTHGHGTHVAAIVKSVLPDVKILALKYYNPAAPSQANVNATIEALRYAVDNNVDIINYSGGGPEAAEEEFRILKKAEKKGILVVAAAGNEQSNIDIKKNAYYPASYGLSNIITVTAHNERTQILSSSNWVKNSVDISAPGHRIRSALPNSRAGYLTGTSQATAFVTGVAAMLKSQHPNLKAAELKDIIKSSAKKEIQLAKRCSSGGRLDAGKALDLANRYLKVKGSSRKIANKIGTIHYRLSK